MYLTNTYTFWKQLYVQRYSAKKRYQKLCEIHKKTAVLKSKKNAGLQASY